MQMISDELKSRLGAAIERHVSRHLKTYEDYNSGVNDVKRFFFVVAEELQLNGYSDDRIMAIYEEAQGNYLLGKKYGVTAKLFAERILKQGNKMYTFDTKLPATGYRNKERNESLVRFSLSEMPYFIELNKPFGWRFNMAVDTANQTYHAVIRNGQHSTNEAKAILVAIPDEAISALVGVATDPEFMNLKHEEIFPNLAILDGVNIDLDIKSSVGRFKMVDNIFMSTEEDGIIPTATKQYQTGIHLIRKAIAEALGEEWGDR